MNLPPQPILDGAFAYIALMAQRYNWSDIECEWNTQTNMFAVSYTEHHEDFFSFKSDDLPPTELTLATLKEWTP